MVKANLLTFDTLWKELWGNFCGIQYHEKFPIIWSILLR